MIPIILGSVALGHLTYQQILGYPTESNPVGEYRLVSFYPVPKTDIYLWILGVGETIPRAYRIDYNIPNRKKLFNFRKSLKDGDIIIIKFSNNKKNKKKKEFILYNLPRPEWLKKDTHGIEH